VTGKTDKTCQYNQDWTGRAKIVSGPHAVDDTKVDANTGVGGPDVGAADARAAWFAVSSADAVRAAAWVAYTDAEAAYIAETTYTNAAAKAAAWAAYAAKAANAMAAAKAYADAKTSFDAAKAAYVVAAAPRAARRALGVVAMLGAAVALVVLGLVGGAWNVRMQEPEVESSAVEVVGVTDGDAGMSSDDFDRRFDAIMATALAEATPSERKAILDAGVTVYATRTGAKYHQVWCRHLRKSRIPMPLTKARKYYGPCSVCHPHR